MTNAIKTEAILTQEGKFEFLYLKNTPAYFAKILELSKKYQSDDKEYQMTVFVDTETREKLELPVDEDGVAINKQLFEVGKDRNKKKKIKFPLESQLKDGEKVSYDAVEGLHGLSLSLNELTKSGKKSILKVVDKDGKDWDKSQAIGNGSIVTVKCFGYRNQDGQLVVSLNLVMVVEHVPYEGNSGGMVEDSILGVSYDMSSAYEDNDSDKVTPESIMDAANNSPTEDFNEENPFF